VTLLLATIPLIAALTGCAQHEGPTESCGAAFDDASAKIEHLYATHPFFGPEYDKLYEDGEITDAEQQRLDEMMSDEEAQYEAIIDPLYDSCDGVEDFYLGAYSQGDKADWALEGNEAISTADLKRIFISSYCNGRQDRKACADFDPDEWSK